MQHSTMDSFSADINVYMRRHKSALFSHGDVSYRFNGKNDKVVLEYCFFYMIGIETYFL